MRNPKFFITKSLNMLGLIGIICFAIGCGEAEKTAPLALSQQTFEAESQLALDGISNETHVWPGDDFQRTVDLGGKVYVHGEWDFDGSGIQRIEVGRQGQNVVIIGIDGAKIIGGF